MDRQLQVLKYGLPAVDIRYEYESQKFARAYVAINQVTMEDGLSWQIPVARYETYTTHDDLKSIAEVLNFDRSFLKDLPQADLDLTDPLISFVYPPVYYRYVLESNGIIGLADIRTDFTENQKELNFISCRRIREDWPLSSDSLEANVTLLKRLGELEFLHFTAESRLVGWM